MFRNNVSSVKLSAQLNSKKKIWKTAKNMWLLYILLFIPFIFLIVFSYIPMYGIIIAFKDYRYADGILGSAWNNFHHFKLLLNDHLFCRSFMNTLIISLYRLVIGFPAPIIFALLLNEMSNIKFKKVTQTISYLPHFISWVVIAGMVGEALSPQRGIVNSIISIFGKEPIYFLTNTTYFRPILILTGIWKEIGWGAVIYLASIASINPELYEAAEIDGANRFYKAIYITIPSMMSVITILFILHIGGILNAGFDQIFNLYNPLVYSVSDIIDTYVYRSGLIDARYDFSTAVGLFKNVIGVIFMLLTNMIVKKYSEHGIW